MLRTAGVLPLGHDLILAVWENNLDVLDVLRDAAVTAGVCEIQLQELAGAFKPFTAAVNRVFHKIAVCADRRCGSQCRGSQGTKDFGLHHQDSLKSY